MHYFKMTTGKLKLITHNGSFHADDIFACATLSLILEKDNKNFEVIRTRDEEIIQSGDYVFDVGGIYDAEKNRFDHHQKGGAGKRENGIEYSSFGLIWQKFGEKFCGSEKVANILDKKLITPIDAGDNAINLFETTTETFPYLIQTMFSAMRPTWQETVTKDEMFLRSVEIAKEVLAREIVQARALVEAEELVMEIYNNTSDKKIIVLDDGYPIDYILSKVPEPFFAVYPRKTTEDWGVVAIKNNPNTFTNRKDLPASWAGLRDAELQKVTRVPDAVFCHRGLFLAVAKSKEGAIKLAQIALES